MLGSPANNYSGSMTIKDLSTRVFGGKLRVGNSREFRRHLSLAQKVVATLTGIITIVGALYSLYIFMRPAPTPDKGRVEAVIEDAKLGKPLELATVEILSTDKVLIATLMTDSSGRVRYDLKDGRYNMRITNAGYSSATREIQVTPGQYNQLTVRLTQSAVKGLQDSVKKVFKK